jgi:hypothetical protein
MKNFVLPDLLKELVAKMDRPNSRRSWLEFVLAAWTQWETTGSVLLWYRSNEVEVIPTALAIPQPKSSDCPNGYYRIQPLYPLAYPAEIVPAEQVQVFRKE